MTVKLSKKVTGFWLLHIKMIVHIKQLTGKMHVGGWTSGRSLTACTKFYCNNVMLQLRLEIYFSHKTNQTYRKCHMHITFDSQQMLCRSLYLLPLQIWIIMNKCSNLWYSQMCKNLLFLLLRQIRVNHMQKCSFGILEKQEQTPVQIRGFAIFLPAFEVQWKLSFLQRM